MKPCCYRVYIGMTAKLPSGALLLFTDAQVREVAKDALARVGLDGCTFLFGDGLWKGEQERSTIVEVVATAEDHRKVRDFCKLVKDELDQEAVLHTVQELQLAEVA